MSSNNFTAQLSHIINGVTFNLQGPGRVMVTFTKSLDIEEWQEFNNTLTDMIRKGYQNWIFNLKDMHMPTSIDIGMWLTCNAKITNSSGSVQFIIKKCSVVQRTLAVTKLNSIFSITYA
jgi:hypothetical protein